MSVSCFIDWNSVYHDPSTLNHHLPQITFYLPFFTRLVIFRTCDFERIFEEPKKSDFGMGWKWEMREEVGLAQEQVAKASEKCKTHVRRRFQDWKFRQSDTKLNFAWVIILSSRPMCWWLFISRDFSSVQNLDMGGKGHRNLYAE